MCGEKTIKTAYLIVKENSSPAPPVMLTWQYFGSSQEKGACHGTERTQHIVKKLHLWKTKLIIIKS